MTTTEASIPQQTKPRMEDNACPGCGGRDADFLLEAEDDLTGKPGRFRFVRCRACGLAHQRPRIVQADIGAYYDSEYIAHRKKKDWGVFTPLYEWGMNGHDRRKVELCGRYVPLRRGMRVLDIGCAVGSFLQMLRKGYGAAVTGVDFKDLRGHPLLEGVDFRVGVLADVDFGETRFDLITMWHFLEHDYEPLQTLERARGLLAPGGRIVVEVPRLDSTTFRLFKDRWPGLQAPQHTVLFDWSTLRAMCQKSGLSIVDHLPWGAFPAYFYLFAGAAFHVLRGKGLDVGKAIGPYFAGQLALSPILLFEKQLNLAMQTIVLENPASGNSP
ncbi:class I SAM-dependent methyltransferase [Polyangium spumosum]|uniref:Methyltransferase domain-containing protein n=1 Tax=Polyangium spumosum TaxID=889282 RepID=A0A6N7PNI6_9BACT|nr:class I SAM-dependent methyltransferase [Polyangium spumosum]MRG91860.1 methyltransferase domain-containing protein [Polyangium spumosum]